MKTLSDSARDNQAIKEKIEKLIENKLYRPRERNTDKLYYKANFLIGGPADVLCNIAGIIKVCIIALEHAGDGFDGLIPEPHTNIQTALEHACSCCHSRRWNAWRKL